MDNRRRRARKWPPPGGDGHFGSARDQEELEAAGALLADEPEPEPDEPDPEEPDPEPDEPEPDPEDEPDDDEPDEDESDEGESDFPGLLAGLDALSEPDERESVR
ncbi:hypothetical protein TPA0908_56790 [Micromonospora sp. AKA38]|nr:hypothetical protein TPA0908_56790 [Micromonospora sp. AKA38]